MTNKQMTHIFSEWVKKIESTLLSKGHDYSKDADRLVNFNTSAATVGINRNIGCLYMMEIKISRLANLLQAGKQPNNESLADNALDLCVYSFLNYCLLIENIKAADNETFLINVEENLKYSAIENLKFQLQVEIKANETLRKENEQLKNTMREVAYKEKESDEEIIKLRKENALLKKNIRPYFNGNTNTGVDLIAKERLEQIEKHGFTIARDKEKNSAGQLMDLALAILAYDIDFLNSKKQEPLFKKIIAKRKIEQLVIVGALIAAEIDRLTPITKPFEHSVGIAYNKEQLNEKVELNLSKIAIEKTEKILQNPDLNYSEMLSHITTLITNYNEGGTLY
jgi:hypothetical protein